MRSGFRHTATISGTATQRRTVQGYRQVIHRRTGGTSLADPLASCGGPPGPGLPDNGSPSSATGAGQTVAPTGPRSGPCFGDEQITKACKNYEATNRYLQGVHGSIAARLGDQHRPDPHGEFVFRLLGQQQGAANSARASLTQSVSIGGRDISLS